MCLLAVSHARADGCFVFKWNKEKDINEPTQKAIIFHDQGREDMVLQVKYEGPAEDFGWLIPVPGLPEVRKGSMDCFYELSKLTQQRFGPWEGTFTMGITKGGGKEEEVKVIEIKTVGAYEVAVLSTGNADKLTEWLNAHDFDFPKEKQSILNGYISNKWYFVAARIDPKGTGFSLKSGAPKKTSIPADTQKKLANGELHPLVISFPSEKCVFPLAISAVNGSPSEVSLYVLSVEPLISPVIYEKKLEAYRREKAAWLAERPKRQKAWEESRKHLEELMSGDAKDAPIRKGDAPSDPRPNPDTMQQLLGFENSLPTFTESDDKFNSTNAMVTSMEVGPKNLPACTKELPRLDRKTLWLTKHVETFAPEEMQDLEFEPIIPILEQTLKSPDGQVATQFLPLFGARAVPVIQAGLSSSNSTERWLAAATIAASYRWARNTALPDLRLVTPLQKMMNEPATTNRQMACLAAGVNWDATFVPRLTELLRDTDEEVSWAACSALQDHRGDLKSQMPVYRKMILEDGPIAVKAIRLLRQEQEKLSRAELVHMLSSTNMAVMSLAATRLRDTITRDEITPLLTNSIPMARVRGIVCLVRIGDKAAVERIVSMLHDPNEAVRWHVRANLRRLTGQSLGPDPAAWEKWWNENNATFTPVPQPQRVRGG